MSEPTTEPTEPTEPTQGEPAELGEGGKKALSAEREARKAAEKSAADLKSRLDEIERANETAVEKAQREAQEARAEVEKLPNMVADQLRDHLSKIHKISDEDRELYLTSNDPSILLKQAMGLVERAPASPRADLTQGGSGEPIALNGDGLEEALKSKLGI